MKKVSILGATGSIGLNTLEVISRHPDKYTVFALSAHKSWKKMLLLCKTHMPTYAVLSDPDAAESLRKTAPEGVTILCHPTTRSACRHSLDDCRGSVPGPPQGPVCPIGWQGPTRWGRSGPRRWPVCSWTGTPLRRPARAAR